MSNRRYRIAWANDDRKLSDAMVREDQVRYIGDGLVVDVLYCGERVNIPAKWLRPVGPELPEPGHVWYRLRGTSEWHQGFLTTDETFVDASGGLDNPVPTDVLEILPTHTTPPHPDGDITMPNILITIRRILSDAGYEHTFLDHAVRAVVKDAKAQPTLRSAEDFSDAELDDLYGEIANAVSASGMITLTKWRIVQAFNHVIQIAKRSTS